MIVVTGATGHLGRHVVEQLLKKVPAAQIVAAVRTPEKAKDLAAKGVQVRRADYNDPASLDAAFQGAQRVLLISSSEVGQRYRQHLSVIEAAQRAVVKQLAYTSVLRADVSKLGLAADHKATEEAIRGSGVPYTLLRNGWYIENYTEHLDAPLKQGSFFGAAKDGRIAGAPRADYAGAAVAVLTSEGHTRKSYELGGAPFTMAELASAVSAWSGKAVNYVDLPQSQYREALVGAGLPGFVADLLSDSDAGIARGELDTDSKDLERLLGRPPTTLKHVLAALPTP